MEFGLTEERYRRITGVLSQFPEIEKALIYGSRARGSYRTGSDIDLALIGDAVTFDLILRIAAALEELPYLYSYDFVDYARLRNQAFKEEIDRDGKVFYEKGSEIERAAY